MIPNGGVCWCVRLKGAMGYGNPPAPDTPPSLNSVILSSQPQCGGKPPGSGLVSFPINGHIFSIDAQGVWLHQHFTAENYPKWPKVCRHISLTPITVEPITPKPVSAAITASFLVEGFPWDFENLASGICSHSATREFVRLGTIFGDKAWLAVRIQF